MKQCVKCRSYAINEHLHGRTIGHLPDHCDVCYWRAMAQGSCEGAERYRYIGDGFSAEYSVLSEAKPAGSLKRMLEGVDGSLMVYRNVSDGKVYVRLKDDFLKRMVPVSEPSDVSGKGPLVFYRDGNGYHDILANSRHRRHFVLSMMDWQHFAGSAEDVLSCEYFVRFGKSQFCSVGLVFASPEVRKEVAVQYRIQLPSEDSFQKKAAELKKLWKDIFAAGGKNPYPRRKV